MSRTTFTEPLALVRDKPSIGPVLVAYDGGRSGVTALERAAAVVGRRGSMVVVNVIPAQSVGARLETVREEDRRRQRELLDEAEAALAHAHVSGDVVAAAGDPVTEIRRVVAERGIGLLVVGRGRTRARHPLRGSVAARLVRSAPCDVLVVR